jgi:hypothetical protein
VDVNGLDIVGYPFSSNPFTSLPKSMYRSCIASDSSRGSRLNFREFCKDVGRRAFPTVAMSDTSMMDEARLLINGKQQLVNRVR